MDDRLKWAPSKVLNLNGYSINVSDTINDQVNQIAGVRVDSKQKRIVKLITWRLYRAFANLILDGFIRRTIRRLINDYISTNTVFLEVGCGDMDFRNYLPNNITYNAFDISLSEFHLKRVLNDNRANICVASATDIPLPSNSVSLIVSSECFGHIEKIDEALAEIHRIAMPNAKLVCSISNGFSYKYQKKGPHPNQLHTWSYDSFIKLAELKGYKMVKGYMQGYWIPLPVWLTKISFQLSISSKAEKMNTQFFFVFEVVK